MKSNRAILRVLRIAACAIMTTSALAQAASVDDDMPMLVQGNNAFAFDLYSQVKGADGNLFFSPFSVSTALAMTYGGARGQTETQMSEVLHFALPQERLHPAFGQLQTLWNSDDPERPYQLSVANALWARADFTILDTFLELTGTHYGAGLKQVDFQGATEQARLAINSWVEEQTQDKIKDLLKPGTLDPATLLVLTNAIYFKGTWQSQFDAAATADAPFTISPSRQVQVPMMHQKGNFRIGGGDGVQVLELPYSGRDLSMVVLLPSEPDGLAALEASLTADNLARWLAGLREREVRVDLPRFKMTSEFDLTKTLEAMGMTEAFGVAADFSGIDGRRGLFISKVVHKAFVSVDEEGTEAAAATGVVMKKTSIAPLFRADHPFVFVIRHNQTGSILFVGRVMDPTAG